MVNQPGRMISVLLIITLCLLAASVFASPKAIIQKWEVLNPEGVIKIEPMKINPHPSTLEGKTIMLRWNGKQGLVPFEWVNLSCEAH